MLPQTQKSYAIVLGALDIPNDPGLELLIRLQTIFINRPLLMEVLKTNFPKNINLQTLLEVLDSIKGAGFPDIEI